jgi:RNA polymerase sigma-70 factor (ECF subfamily)
MGRFNRAVKTTDEAPGAAYTSFVEEVEPRLKRALCVGYGTEQGVEATAEALAYGWEHWERVGKMENPAGYLYRVGTSKARKRRSPRPEFPSVPSDGLPWVEPGLPVALSRLSTAQRQSVWLVHGFEWTASEVAAVLDVSVSTVRKHLERAEKKLRRALGVSP